MIIAALFLAQAMVPLEAIETYAREAWDRTVTPCDRLIAHPSDPEKVVEGVLRADADLPAAITACHAAVAADPENPRLNYQLARAFAYSGQHAESQPYAETALKAGYPQSLFVFGYVRLENWDGAGADPCYGGALIRQSAQAGRLAGLVGFPHYYLMGRFEVCEHYPVIDHAEMISFLDQAEARADDFYQGLLITQLKAQLAD